MLQLGYNSRIDSRDQRGAFVAVFETALAPQSRGAVVCVLADAGIALSNQLGQFCPGQIDRRGHFSRSRPTSSV
jgi:hypothetical protein